jgi:hypothetical protein
VSPTETADHFLLAGHPLGGCPDLDSRDKTLAMIASRSPLQNSDFTPVDQCFHEIERTILTLNTSQKNVMPEETWTNEDSRRAVKQGWDLFVIHGKYWDIEKDDDEDIFPDDLAALEFLKKAAGGGDALAAKALRLDGTLVETPA